MFALFIIVYKFEDRRKHAKKYRCRIPPAAIFFRVFSSIFKFVKKKNPKRTWSVHIRIKCLTRCSLFILVCSFLRRKFFLQVICISNMTPVSIRSYQYWLISKPCTPKIEYLKKLREFYSSLLEGKKRTKSSVRKYISFMMVHYNDFISAYDVSINLSGSFSICALT